MPDLPHIVVDETEGSPFARIHRIATRAANGWALGPNGPYERPGQTMSDIAEGQVRTALLHLLELGLIRIDEQALDALKMYKPWREEDRG